MSIEAVQLFRASPPCIDSARSAAGNGERIASTSRCNQERHPLRRFDYGSAALAFVLASLAESTFSSQSQLSSRIMHPGDAVFEV